MSVALTQVGNVEAYETVALRSRIDSQVVRATFKDGDEVAQGALLFVLDDRALQAQERELAANLARDRAQLVNLQRQYERVKVIAAKGFETRTALDQAGTKYQLEVLPGTQHGFCFAERAVYSPIAAEQTWGRIFDLWARTLD